MLRLFRNLGLLDDGIWTCSARHDSGSYRGLISVHLLGRWETYPPLLPRVLVGTLRVRQRG